MGEAQAHGCLAQRSMPHVLALPSGRGRATRQLVRGGDVTSGINSNNEVFCISTDCSAPRSMKAALSARACSVVGITNHVGLIA